MKGVKILSTKNNIKYFDSLTSPILQFSLGGFYPYERNLLQRARFYYIKGYYEAGNFIYKAEDFIKWSDSVIRTFKKQFLKNIQRGYFSIFRISDKVGRRQQGNFDKWW